MKCFNVYNYFTGPVATALLGVFSHRKLVIIGGFTSGTGLALSAMATSVAHLGMGLTLAGRIITSCVDSLSCPHLWVVKRLTKTLGKASEVCSYFV